MNKKTLIRNLTGTCLLALCAACAQAQQLPPVSAADWGGAHSSYPASNAIDGSTNWSSRWAASGSPVNLYVDLGSAQAVTEVGVAWGDGNSRSYVFEIWARSGTSGSWTKVFDDVSSGNSTDIEVYDITNITARQVRVKTFSNSASSSWTNITEFEVYGSKGSGSGGGSSTVPPSGNFDLSQWKLTLPVSKTSYFGSGGSSAAEILPGENCNVSGFTGDPLDDGYEDSNYFYTGSDGTMVFETPLSGGASTISSSYVRSELRELYDWSPCEDDGAANWSPSGTHVLSGTLKVVDYYAADPQTVVGQIHAKNSDKALLKLQWDGPTKDIRAIVNANPTSGNPFSIDFGLIPGTDEWSYVITLDDGTMTIAVTYNGTTVTESVTFGSGSMSSDWDNHAYYFKAGNYAQADKNSGGNFEVRFSALNTSHSN